MIIWMVNSFLSCWWISQETRPRDVPGSSECSGESPEYCAAVSDCSWTIRGGEYLNFTANHKDLRLCEKLDTWETHRQTPNFYHFYWALCPAPPCYMLWSLLLMILLIFTHMLIITIIIVIITQMIWHCREMAPPDMTIVGVSNKCWIVTQLSKFLLQPYPY